MNYRKHFILFFASFATILLFSFANKEFKLYYSTGELQFESKYDNKCGCYREIEYYKTGEQFKTKNRFVRPNSISTYIDGEDIIYYIDGSIQIYYNWKNGVYDGRAYCNDSLGQLVYEQFYKNGFKEGKWTVYNKDRSINCETVYENNKSPWDSEKEFCTVRHFYKGKSVFEKRIENGVLVGSKIIDSKMYNEWHEIENLTGKALFNANCAMCHSIKNDIVGPKLENVTKIRDRNWLYSMILDGDSLYQANDKIALDLYTKWNKTKHPSYRDLTKGEINTIIDFLDDQK